MNVGWWTLTNEFAFLMFPRFWTFAFFSSFFYFLILRLVSSSRCILFVMLLNSWVPPQPAFPLLVDVGWSSRMNLRFLWSLISGRSLFFRLCSFSRIRTFSVVDAHTLSVMLLTNWLLSQPALQFFSLDVGWLTLTDGLAFRMFRHFRPFVVFPSFLLLDFALRFL